MVDNVFKTLRLHLPVSNSDEERRHRLRMLAVGFESRFYKEATSKDSYKRKIAMLLIYVEKMNQNSHRQAPELPPQGNDPEESSGVPLTSLQQTQQPKTSTSVQDSYLPSLAVGQAFTLQNMSGQSSIRHIQLMGTQSAIQSGAQQNPLNIGQQPMQSLCLQSPQYLEGQPWYPQLSMNHQPALQQNRLTQESSFPLQQQQQESMGQQPNLHQIQLICQQTSAVDMPQQHGLPVDVLVPRVSTENFGNFRFAVSPGLAICHTVASEAGNLIDPLASTCSGVQLGTSVNNADREHVMPTDPEMETDIPFSRNEDSTFSDQLRGLLTWESPPPLFSVHEAEDEKCKAIMEDSDFNNVGSSSFYAEHEFSQLPGTEIGNEQEDCVALLSSPGSGSQMENTEDEVQNFESMADEAANRNKRKFDHISS